MEQAKAVINLKEGVIQLEGPVEFVRHYLDIYRFSIRELQGAAEDVAATKERRASAVGRSEGAKPVSCSSAVREEFESGFFAEPRSVRETSQRLIEKGITCTSESIRMALNRLCGEGLADRVKKKGLFQYCRKA